MNGGRAAEAMVQAVLDVNGVDGGVQKQRVSVCILPQTIKPN